MKRMSRAGASELALIAWLSLAGCTETDDTDTPSVAAGAAGLASGAAPDDAPDDGTAEAAPPAPNFEFVVGESYLDDRSASLEYAARLEAFFGEVVLGPLQRLPGLMPRTVTVTYERCGVAGSFHDGPSATITLCHELAEHARRLFATGDYPLQGEAALTRGVLQAMAFVLYHEVGHALDQQRDVPLAGNVESGIDAIATVISIETGQYLYPLGGAVLFSRAPPSFAAGHGGGLDRRGDIECWAVGGSELVAATQADAGLAQQYDFDAAGRDCAAEYARLRDTVRGWVPGLARLAVGVPEPEPDARSSFRLALGPTWLQGAGADARRDVTRLFESAFARLDNAVDGLSAPIDVTYDECGAPTSSWDASSRTVTLCAELVEHVYPALVAPFGPVPTVAQSAYALGLAYPTLEFHLYHEIGHALGTMGRLPGRDPLEIEADAIAAVLLVEAGDGIVVAFSLLYAVLDQPPEQAALHGDGEVRAVELLCLTVGGDAALRSDPDFITEETLQAFVTGERDCVAEYAARRDEVRAWLASPAG